MKIILKKIYWFLLTLAIQSCTDDSVLNQTDDTGLQNDKFLIDTNYSFDDLSEFKSLLSESYDNRVTIKDVVSVENTIFSKSHKSKISSDNIIPIVTDCKDTILYAVNYPEGGYRVYSTDKRFEPVVVESENGYFDMKDGESAIWLSLMADNLVNSKKAEDKELKLSEEEINSNKLFWTLACNPTELIKTLRGKRHITRSAVPDPTGHYEYFNSFITSEAFDSIDHLTTTYWHQGTPFNDYCPYKSDWSERVLAGCVPIAGAQMLYYLHNNFGYPTAAPLTASCVGNINNYSMSQSNFSTTAWSIYDANLTFYCPPAAPLIANLGNLVRINYGDKVSGADLENLAEDAFPAYGVDCDYRTYDANSIKSSLLQSKPVIVGAFAIQHHFLGFESHRKGHAFIIDGFKRTKKKITTVYLWIPDDQEDVSECEETVTIEYQSPEISYFKINWGWGQNSYFEKNDAWYSSSDGLWKTFHPKEDDPNETDSTTYRYDKVMLINCRPIN